SCRSCRPGARFLTRSPGQAPPGSPPWPRAAASSASSCPTTTTASPRPGWPPSNRPSTPREYDHARHLHVRRDRCPPHRRRHAAEPDRLPGGDRGDPDHRRTRTYRRPPDRLPAPAAVRDPPAPRRGRRIVNLLSWLTRRPRPVLPGPDLTLTAAYRAADIAHARELIAQATRDLDVWQETGAEPSRLAALALLDQALNELKGTSR